MASPAEAGLTGGLKGEENTQSPHGTPLEPIDILRLWSRAALLGWSSASPNTIFSKTHQVAATQSSPLSLLAMEAKLSALSLAGWPFCLLTLDGSAGS